MLIKEKIILAGNPNVGKSTLFNRLTSQHQHTGNWCGKTVGSAMGYARLGESTKLIIDSPGTYSLTAASEDEAVARDIVCSEPCERIVAVCDGCCLERGLYLALQIMQKRSSVIVCVNLMDEAAKKGIKIDIPKLSELLSCPVVGISAGRNKGIEKLEAILSSPAENGGSHFLSPTEFAEGEELKKKAARICESVVTSAPPGSGQRFDSLLCHPLLAWPIMCLMLLLVLWLSISAANYPSLLLSRLFERAGDFLLAVIELTGLPLRLCSLLKDGIYDTVTWVISVMLPPMAIFFPLFSLLEDFGLLPRIAFNMDHVFRKCGGCGKQALCMCMGIGCNAVGVSGCRIISGRRERLIAILTNSFVPCNGRFPTLILMAGLLFPGGGPLTSSLCLLCLICIAAGLTFISSKLLSKLLLKDEQSFFVLELPPFRRPRILETLWRSFMEKSLHVMLRALKAAAPAGLIIWLLANLSPGGESLLGRLQTAFDPVGEFFGMDGAILLGFVLGLPANEIVLPLIMMCYVSGSSMEALPPISALGPFLANMGWTPSTIICIMLFTLLHWPCATTLMTIKKECGGLRWVFLAAALPSLWGFLLCLGVRLLT